MALRGRAGNEHDFAGHFVVGQLLPHELLEGLLVEIDAVVGGDEGDRVARLCAGRARRSPRFLHPGKLVEDFLDLARIDVDAVDQQHVLLAVGDEVIAVGRRGSRCRRSAASRRA